MKLPSRLLVLGIGTVLLGTGCRREVIRVYTAPKDAPVVDSHDPADTVASADAPEAHPAAAPAKARPKVSWTLPAGWEEAAPSQISVAQFVIKSPAGEATVSITPLPNLAGKEAMIVNMWREQVGQTPLDQNQIEKALTALPVAGGNGQLFEITGTRDGAGSRIITAMLHRPDASWFFKLAGGEAAVAGQKEAFVAFLQTVKIGETASEASPAAKTP